MIIIFPKLIGQSFSALSIYPFVILKNKDLKTDKILLNHEYIHLQQQKELLWLIFFVWYVIEFLIKLIYYHQSYKAYRNISFEREAYHYETDLTYLKKRNYFAFLKFL